MGLFFADHMAASVAHFVCFEVGHLVEVIFRSGSLAAGWMWTVIAVVRMETVIYVAMEIGWAVEPGASADEDAADKPFRSVIAVGGAVVRRNVIIAVRTLRRDSDVHAHLSLCCGSSQHKA